MTVIGIIVNLSQPLLQVTEEMVNALAASGHSCHLRGPIFVKGKGTITTYFVETPFDKPGA